MSKDESRQKCIDSENTHHEEEIVNRDIQHTDRYINK